MKKLQNKTDQETSENSKCFDAKDASAPETANPTEERESVDEAGSSHQSEAVNTQKQPQNEEDVSFSDLEEEDDNASTRRVSTSDKAWVQLDENTESQGPKQKADHNSSKDKESEGEDWLTVDDTDFDNLEAM